MRGGKIIYSFCLSFVESSEQKPESSPVHVLFRVTMCPVLGCTQRHSLSFIMRLVLVHDVIGKAREKPGQIFMQIF